MSNNLVDKVRRVQSSFVIVLLFIAAVCLASAGCSGEADKASASDVIPLAARVDRLDGEVGIDRQTDPQDSNQDQSKTDWAKAVSIIARSSARIPASSPLPNAWG